MNPSYLVLGEVLRPHGIRGELRIRLLTDYPERIAKLKTVYLADKPEPETVVPYEVQGMRMNGDYGLLRLKGITTREEADRLRALYLLVDLPNAVPLEEGEFYLYQLIGMKVETVEGEAIGTLVEVLETRANDVYIVDSPNYGEVLIPVTPETIVKTDVEAGKVIVSLPEGLLQTKPPESNEE